MIQVTFYVSKKKIGERFPTMEKVVLNTGKTTIAEAFAYAVEHGAQWDKLIKYTNLNETENSLCGK